MNNYIKVLVVIIITSLLITGCSKLGHLKDIAIQNLMTESKLPQYNLDKETYDKISYDNKLYLITEEKVAINLIDKPIGKISYSCTLDANKVELLKGELRNIDMDGNDKREERDNLSFRWVHKIKSENLCEIVVNINNLYYKCKISD